METAEYVRDLEDDLKLAERDVDALSAKVAELESGLKKKDTICKKACIASRIQLLNGQKQFIEDALVPLNAKAAKPAGKSSLVAHTRTLERIQVFKEQLGQIDEQLAAYATALDAIVAA